MSTNTIKIIKPTASSNKCIIGERTIRFMKRQTKLSERQKCIVIDEAKDILDKCIKPGVHKNITNIAIGYVQSGKTLSFTTLTTLAADNGYRIIIYLAGNKNNLQNQTAERLAADLNIEEEFSTYRIFSNIDSSMSFKNNIMNFLNHTTATLLFPILKHHTQIGKLASVFYNLQPELSSLGVLIIDDEADQSSFNTYARKNALNENDWKEDDFSSTYSSILTLKKNLPSHSYIQYTATPQAAFLIDNNDILSPTFHTVLTPGEGYTGGKLFFRERKEDLIRIIPKEECYHYKRNPLDNPPKSFETALREFLVSVAIKVYLLKEMPFLSMMIHIDGTKQSNEKFFNWTSSKTQLWLNILSSPIEDPGRDIEVRNFHKAYESITQFLTNKPSFEEVINKLPEVIVFSRAYLIQEDSDNKVDWKEYKANILVGAEMLNRGFTIENLSMTYMPRTSVAKSTADTIEQRCRFFGYKAKYIDVCRVYLPYKGVNDYVEYVAHEENLRSNLKQCSCLADFAKHKAAMLIADRLNPTRTNILSKRLVRSKLCGWSSLRSIDGIEENKAACQAFLHSWSAEEFTLYHDYGNTIRNHRYVKCPIDTFIDFFKNMVYHDMPTITRKIVTIQYFLYLKETQGVEYVYVVEMAYGAKRYEELRKRSLEKDSRKPKNLMAGRAADGSYPGDDKIRIEDSSICVQFHHIRIEDRLGQYHKKDLYNLAIYYPEQVATSFVSTNSEDDE